MSTLHSLVIVLFLSISTCLTKVDFDNLTQSINSYGSYVQGSSSNSQLGFSVSSAGDMNQDGFGDVIVSEFNFMASKTKVYVLFGTSQGIPDVSLSSFVTSDSTGFVFEGFSRDHLGYSVSGAGDFNNDGYDDILIGSHGQKNSTGSVYVVFGRSSGFVSYTTENFTSSNFHGFAITGTHEYEEFGKTLSNAGDVNGDGYDDIIVGSRYWDSLTGSSDVSIGRAYVIFGKASGIAPVNANSIGSGVAGFIVEGSSRGEYLGYSVSNAGDVNGDRLDDIIIGTNGGDNVGFPNAYVLYGKANGFNKVFTESFENSESTGFTITIAESSLLLGWQVSSVYDTNKDGFSDVGFSARYSGYASTPEDYISSTGIVFGKQVQSDGVLIPVPASHGILIRSRLSDEFHSQSICGANDVNGDGFDDFFVSSIRAPSQTELSFGTYLLYGQQGNMGEIDLSSSNIEAYLFSGSIFEAASGGDVNDDGFSDILLGSRQSSNTNNPGAVISITRLSTMNDFVATPSPTIMDTLSPTNSPSMTPSISPTISPTRSPSFSPIKSPTSAPTQSPTAAPTELPTSAPTGFPTILPTLTPTIQPTEHPTMGPTNSPSKPPTLRPTSWPTGSPTAGPINSPTRSPSINPTGEPTESPTSPTVSPSTSPNFHPTASPSTAPTTSPTHIPTLPPTSFPTTVPVKVPTLYPSDSPTREPSQAPTVAPSTSPSTSPSHHPTLSPSFVPSKSPSVFPTVTPSLKPTSLNPTSSPYSDPTFEPTKAPSTQPSIFPSTEPTVIPTSLPTISPTSTPSAMPSRSPTALPTGVPSNEPTTNPSEFPTCSPTLSPTTGPSSSPSLYPTQSPTVVPTSEPTSHPTSFPTRLPTRSPSVSPSVSPSDFPTESPTLTPTSSPTVAPSTTPTRLPTTSPSVSPTRSPTLSPTQTPTNSPSLTPTVTPTTTPTGECPEVESCEHVFDVCPQNTCTTFVDEAGGIYGNYTCASAPYCSGRVYSGVIIESIPATAAVSLFGQSLSSGIVILALLGLGVALMLYCGLIHVKRAFCCIPYSQSDRFV